MSEGLKIGQYTVPYPIIQGGMGVRISAHRLAGQVALQGGVGIIAAAGLGLGSERYDGRNYFVEESWALKEELRKAYEIAPDGVIGVNCMVAVSNFDDTIKAACEGGAKVIISGAGLPMNLPGLTAEFPEVALVPIVSSLKAAELIARKWHRTFQRLPDAVVVEDPDTAGGHLGEKMERIGSGDYDQYATVRRVKSYFQDKWNLDIPIIAAGGIWDQDDLQYAFANGADGVQMATRFVVTEECDADEAFKQAYLDCNKDDIGLIMSPAGLPGRALSKNIEQVRQRDVDLDVYCPSNCLKKCTYKENRERFCIVHALERSRKGDMETGLVFCGTNAWKADQITTVKAIFEELFSPQKQAAG